MCCSRIWNSETTSSSGPRNLAGIDGRTHHLNFSDLEMTGDAPAGAIVEARAYDDANGRRRLSLATRSDLSVEAQTTASGATWLDRRLLAKDPPLSSGGFGAEVRDAMEARIDHLAREGLARRQGRARGVCPRSSRDPAASRAGREGVEARGGDGPRLSACSRRRACFWCLSSARDARLRPFRHARRRARFPARAVAAGPGEGARP